jgi:hypothetical protein
MDKRQIQYVDRCIWDWVAWESDGRSSPGLYPAPYWPGKPAKDAGQPRRATNRRNPLVPPPQPHETPRKAGSRILLCKTDKTSPLVRKVILRLDDDHKLIVWGIYLNKMSFREISERFGLTSRQVGDTRHNVLSAVNDVL